MLHTLFLCLLSAWGGACVGFLALAICRAAAEEGPL